MKLCFLTKIREQLIRIHKKLTLFIFLTISPSSLRAVLYDLYDGHEDGGTTTTIAKINVDIIRPGKYERTYQFFYFKKLGCRKRAYLGVCMRYQKTDGEHIYWDSLFEAQALPDPKTGVMNIYFLIGIEIELSESMLTYLTKGPYNKPLERVRRSF